MIAAFWANDGMNDDKGTRQNAIQEVETNFEEAVIAITSGNWKSEQEAEIDKSNPFFSAMERGMAKLEIPAGMDEETMKAIVEQQNDFDRFIDQ